VVRKKKIQKNGFFGDKISIEKSLTASHAI